MQQIGASPQQKGALGRMADKLGSSREAGA
jgi:hypothetical protein